MLPWKTKGILHDGRMSFRTPQAINPRPGMSNRKLVRSISTFKTNPYHFGTIGVKNGTVGAGQSRPNRDSQGSLMSHETDPQSLTITDLAQRCEQETNRYFRRREHDPRYCFELFRRAIQHGDQSVWENIYPCYNALVASWVKQHPGFESTGEKVEYFVNGAFGKLSVTLTSERFRGFSDLGSVLSYLKLCVHSVIVDHNRAADQASLFSLDDASEEPSADPPPEAQVLERVSQHELWERITERLHDEKERSVMQGIFVFDLKPRELYDHSPTIFTDVHEIYRIKQNILARLRRDPEIRKFLGAGD